MNRPNLRSMDDDRGAEVIEFALVFPVVAFLILGLLYGLFAVAANVSLAHAVSRGARYASIPTDPVDGIYHTQDEVAAYVDDQTPFFSASACTTSLTGNPGDNQPMVLNVSCNFPNPAGKALSGLRNLFLDNNDGEKYSDSLVMSARAEARRE